MTRQSIKREARKVMRGKGGGPGGIGCDHCRHIAGAGVDKMTLAQATPSGGGVGRQYPHY